jgi:6-phosphogluconolactonase (cycloisomerase 2 family)
MRIVLAVVPAFLLATGPAWAASTGLANVQTITTDDEPDITTPEAVAVSTPDGAFVYVVAPSAGVVVFARDAGTGKLTKTSVVSSASLAIPFRPGAIVMGPASDWVYTGDDFTVSVFSRDFFSGALTLLQQAPSPLFRTKDLALSPDGTSLYVVSQRDDEVQVFARDTGSGLLTTGQLVEDGQGGVTGLDGPTAIEVSPDGLNVYVATSHETIVVFGRDPVTGNLAFVEAVTETVPDTLSLLNDMVISPDGLFVYVAPDDSSVNGPTVYARNPTTGSLTFVETGDPYGVIGINPFTRRTRALALSPDGSQLVGVTRNTISLYDRDATTGHLTFVGAEAQAGERVAMSPDGLHVYVASGFSNVGAFRQLSIACAPAPMAGCRTTTIPGHAAVRLQGFAPSDSSKFDWKLRQGQATDVADLGDVIAGTDDVIACVYDASASPQPVFDTVGPAAGICDLDRPCWKPRGSTPGKRHVKYKDPDRRPDGLDTIDLKEGPDGFASLKVKAKSTFMMPPALPLTTPVRVQLQTVAGTCWESVFSTPKINDAGHFRALSD